MNMEMSREKFSEFKKLREDLQEGLLPDEASRLTELLIIEGNSKLSESEQEEKKCLIEKRKKFLTEHKK